LVARADNVDVVTGERLPGVNGTLSARQAEIAGLVASGKSTREIAESLSLSSRTVETHVQAVFEKLGVRSRVELNALLIRNAAVERRPVHTRGTLASLVGRGGDVRAIVELLLKHRVVTVVAAGGVGKTQASLRVVEAVRDSFADGAFILELASLSSGEYVPAAIAQLFGISLSGSDVTGSLVRQLATKRALIVFDNCDHLLDDVGALASQIVKTCNAISILATSREALRISAERTYRLGTLRVPSDASVTASLRATEIADYPAIELFVERARAVDDRFVVSDATMPAIGEICRRLDGVPLAIELAAVRMNTFAPAQILARIDDRLELLRSSARDAPSRHQSMLALIDWSYDTLADGERVLLRRLSIFVGSFGLEGALAIGTRDDTSENDVVESLASLIDKSLVMVDREGDTLRYRFFESTRVYARRKLLQAAEHDETSARLVRHLADRFTSLRERAGGWHPADFYAAFAAALGDIRASLDEAYARGDYEPGGKLLAAIGYYWFFLGLDREGLARNEAYIAALSQHPLRFAMMPGFVDLSFKNGFFRVASERAQSALRDARDWGDPRAITIGLNMVAATEQRVDVVRALLADIEAVDDRSAELDIWYGLRKAWVDMRSQRCEQANARLRGLYAQCLAVGDAAISSNILLRLAQNEYNRGDLAAAVSFSLRAADTIRSLGSGKILANTLHALSCYLCAVEDLPAAGAAVREALTIVASIDPQSGAVSLYVEGVSFVRVFEGDNARGAMLSAFARAAFSHVGELSAGVLGELRSRVDDLLLERLGEAELRALRSRGEQLTARDAIELALA